MNAAIETTRGHMNRFEKAFYKAQFGNKQRTEFYEQMISLVRADMTRKEALDTIWLIASRDGKKPKEAIALIITDIKRGLESGLSFGEAMEPWVPQDDVMVLNAIENSPDFAGGLENYIELDKRRKKMIASTVGGMIYPMILLMAAYALVIHFGKNVMPQLDAMYPMEKWAGPAYVLKLMTIFSEKYVVPTTIIIIVTLVSVIVSLPRWYGFGRSKFDNLPIYGLYRSYTGINFLVAMAALTGGGMKVNDALKSLIPKANPYVKHRLKAAEQGLLSGKNLGAALYESGYGWPDPNINLNLKVFAATKDLASSMDKISKDSLSATEKKMAKSLGIMKGAAMGAVFGVLMSVMLGIFGLQAQIGSEISF